MLLQNRKNSTESYIIVHEMDPQSTISENLKNEYENSSSLKLLVKNKPVWEKWIRYGKRRQQEKY